MKKWIFVIGLTTIDCLYGFEVNTHQALTRCAITTECNTNGGVNNLDTFVQNTNLSGYKKYDKEFFEKYKFKGQNVSYEDYMEEAEKAIKNYKVKTTGDYKGMIEAGSILEDAVHHNAVFSGDGRFNNHFYAAQLNSKAHCAREVLSVAGAAAIMGGRSKDPVSNGFKALATGATVVLGNKALMKTDKTLCLGFGARTDSIDWVLNKDVDLSMTLEINNQDYGLRNRKNSYGLEDAFTYFQKSFEGTESERRKNQAKLFVSLGFMVHLLQDIHSPSHCRDSSHPKGDYLEMYGRHEGGFFLEKGSFSHGKNNPHIAQAIKTFDMKGTMLKKNRFVSYEDFFKKEAEWVSKNFFAEAHMPIVKGINSSFAGGTTINNPTDIESIFDDNPLPSKDTTYENDKDEIASTGNTVKHIHGDLITYDGLGEKPIALIDRGDFFDNEHMILPTYKMDHGLKKLVPGRANTRALEMTAINVMPRAVASTQAFINFFFRGQIEATLSDDWTTLSIKNVSDETLVSDKRLVTFKQGGHFKIYYTNQNGMYVTLTVSPFHTLTQDLHVGETFTINLQDYIERANLKEGSKVTVVFDGNIGDNLDGLDSYNIGMRGLSADIFEVPNNALECTGEEKLVMEDIVWMQKYINQNLTFSIPDLNTPYPNQKRVYIYKNSRYKAPNNWRVTDDVSSNWNDRRYVNHAIDYFNKNIYHLVIKPPPLKEKYVAEVWVDNTAIKQGENAVQTRLSYNVKLFKGNTFIKQEKIENLIRIEWYNGDAHFHNATQHHFDIWCENSPQLCQYLRNYVAGDNHTEYQDWKIHWTIWAYGGQANNLSYFVASVPKRIAQYYERGNNPPAITKYPSNWGYEFVKWIRSVNTNDCRTLREKKK